MNFNAWLLRAVVAAALASVVVAGNCRSCNGCDVAEGAAISTRTYAMTASGFTYSNSFDVTVVLFVAAATSSSGNPPVSEDSSRYIVDPQEACQIVGPAGATSARVSVYPEAGKE